MDDKNSTLKNTYKTIKEAVPTSIISFVVGHPFDLVKTKMQANPNLSSGFKLAKQIFNKEGIRGLYTSGSLNYLRSLFKICTRTNFYGYLMKRYEFLFPTKSINERKTIASLSLSLIDTFLMSPIERLKVNKMTLESKKLSPLQIVNQIPIDKYRIYFYKGTLISLVRSSISWLSYLRLEGLIQQKYTDFKQNGVAQTTELNKPERLLIGSTCGIFNCLLTLPLDAIKTHVQQDNYEGSASVKAMANIAKTRINQNGFAKGMYPGFMTRLVHYSLIGMLTTDLNHKIEKIWLSKPTR